MRRRRNTTGIAVTGLGTVVTGIGALLRGRVGAGVVGFGLAHVVLGLLDNFRPVTRK